MSDIKLPQYEKLSCTLLTYERMRLRLHVRLINENEGKKESYLKSYDFSDKKLLSADFFSFLTLEYVPKSKEEKSEWDKSRAILINQKNIFRITNAIEQVRKNIYKEDIFSVENNGKIIIYGGMAEKFSETILRPEYRLIIKPAVVYDENDLSYEGVVMFINNLSNGIELTIDEYDSFVYLFKKIDLFLYSQALINHYLTLKNESEVSSVPMKNTKGSTQLKQHPLKDFAKSNIFTVNEEDNVFKGL